MRQIERLMNRAIKHRAAWKLSNTEVHPSGAGLCAVYLHGNHIADVVSLPHSKSSLAIPNLATLRAYPSRTTKSRLRALGINVYTKHGVTYVGDIAI